jgi:drug/metabolite transporter (DMT)-like permease
MLTTLFTMLNSRFGFLDMKVSGLQFPPKVLLIGTCGGVIASLALFVFQTGLKHGKISTSWLIINLATSIPILMSIFLFNETINVLKIAGMLLVLAAVVMLWLDKKIDLENEPLEKTALTSVQTSKWLPLMMLAFVGQGLAASSQKVLVEAKAGDYVWQFYIILYWSGFLVMTLLTFLRGVWPNRRELMTGLVMAVCSVVGNVSITMAMEKKVQGVIAYPVSNGGSLSIVVLAGVLFFREKIHPVGIAGIICGISAILILVLA